MTNIIIYVIMSKKHQISIGQTTGLGRGSQKKTWHNEAYT